MSRSLETRFDRVQGLVIKSLFSRDTASAWRVNFSVVGRIKKTGTVGGRYQYSKRRTLQNIRQTRAWLQRSKRLGGRLQVLLADFAVRVDVDHEMGGQVTASGDRVVDGYAHLVLGAAKLRELGLSTRAAVTAAHRADDAREDAAAASDAVPDVGKRWWSPGSGYGLTMDYVERLGGVAELYDQIVPFLVGRGYLPAQAMPAPADGQPPGLAWELLQSFAGPSATTRQRTGAVLNQAGQEYANWRLLVRTLSEEWLITRGDDVFAGEDGQPGVVMSFVRPQTRPRPGGQTSVLGQALAPGPGKTSLAEDQTLTIALSVKVGASRHGGRHPYTVQWNHISIDTAAARWGSGSADEGAVTGGGDPHVSDGYQLRFGGGGQVSTVSNRRQGRNQSTAVSSDTDAQNMPSSRYDVDIVWGWQALIGDAQVQVPDGQRQPVAAVATLLQPDELHARADEAVLAVLADPTADGGTEEVSVLRTMGAVVYTAVGAKGVGSLQRGVIETSTLSKVDVWTGLTPAVYKSVLMRALAGAGTVLLGDQAAALTTTPVGRPQVVKVWKPNTQHLLEAQVGKEGFGDQSSTGGGQGAGGHVSEHFVADSATAISGGSGSADSELDTVGNHRGVYQDTEMALVRTAVTNELVLGDGTRVTRRGEVVLNVLLTDVLRHRYGFDDPQDKIVGYFDRFVTEAEHKLVLAAEESARKTAREALDKAERNLRIAKAAVSESMPSAAALDSELAPPASVQDGLSGAAVWSLTFDGGPGQVGLGAFMTALTAAAQAVGGSELVTAVTTMGPWFGPLLAKMSDGGEAWTVPAGGHRYRLAVTAQQIGPARGSREGGTGQKIYERGNQYQDAGRKNITSLTTTTNLAGLGDGHDDPSLTTTTNLAGGEDAHDQLPLRGQVTHNRIDRADQTDTRGSNLLFMQGLRANKLTDFTQAVEFRFTLKKIDGLIPNRRWRTGLFRILSCRCRPRERPAQTGSSGVRVRVDPAPARQVPHRRDARRPGDLRCDPRQRDGLPSRSGELPGQGRWVGV